ncbi:MAG: endonuclease III [Dehalococcoidia bacterium]|nr:endonuclease III [Dehalococcoidia bacterium]
MPERQRSQGAAAKTLTKRRDRKAARPAEVMELLREEQGPLVWRRRYEPVDELVVTILSQHTSDLNAERSYAVLKLAYSTWDAVADASLEEIEAAIRGSGLARQKAPRIRETLRKIRELRGALDLEFLRDLPLGDAKRWLTALPGVGPKTAAVLLCFAMGMPAMAVDTHVYRVARRLGLIGPKVSVERAHPLLEQAVAPGEVYSFHLYLITHGRRVCQARRPRCEACVLSAICPSSTVR